jgi:hypothetical protein
MTAISKKSAVCVCGSINGGRMGSWEVKNCSRNNFSGSPGGRRGDQIDEKEILKK